MDRLACVNIPSLPLQILLERRPEWAPFPVAVVDKDHPQGIVLWANETALAHHIGPGLRYAAGRSIQPDLRADVVPRPDVERWITTFTHELYQFTPEVEASKIYPGIFWLNATGLSRLYPSLRSWAQAVQKAIAQQKFHGHVAVGFTRFGTYAAAKTNPSIMGFNTREQEKQYTQQVPLNRLNVPDKLRSVLAKLAIKTVGQFLALPAAGLRNRLGKDAYEFYRWAAGKDWDPLTPSPPEQAPQFSGSFDFAIKNRTALNAFIQRHLPDLLTQLVHRSQALQELQITLTLESGDVQTQRIRPAAPTLQASLLQNLVTLQLETLQLSAGVADILLLTKPCPASREQLRLFRENSRRDLSSANRALARVRAQFGEQAVLYAQLHPGHLPEAQFSWQPLAQLTPPQRSGDANAPPDKSLLQSHPQGHLQSHLRDHPQGRFPGHLIRRIRQKPHSLFPRHRHPRDNGWLLHNFEEGAVVQSIGPFIVSGGWWAHEVHREYYFVQTGRGTLAWIYYDKMRRRWFLHGQIE